MLRRPSPRYLTGARLGRLLTTTTPTTRSSTSGPSVTTTATTGPSPPAPNSISGPASTETSPSTLKSSEYTPGTIRPAQQWHSKENGGARGSAGEINGGSGGGSKSDMQRTTGPGSGIGSRPGRRPSRGGQDLSARYTRLENAVRGKQARAEAHAATVSGAAATVAATSSNAAGETATTPPDAGLVNRGKAARVEMFRGLVVPEEPKPPADDECCMSGCAVCVYDLHEEELEAYAAALGTLRASLVALGVPPTEWPARVRPTSASTSTTSTSDGSNSGPVTTATVQSQEKSRKGAVLSAFEEMERRLAEKHRDEVKADGNAGSDAGAGGRAGVHMEEKQGVQAQAAVAPSSLDLRESSWGADTITIHHNAAPHWRERQQLAAETQKAARRRTFWTELYEGARWVLFSNR